VQAPSTPKPKSWFPSIDIVAKATFHSPHTQLEVFMQRICISNLIPHTIKHLTFHSALTHPPPKFLSFKIYMVLASPARWAIYLGYFRQPCSYFNLYECAYPHACTHKKSIKLHKVHNQKQYTSSMSHTTAWWCSKSSNEGHNRFLSSTFLLEWIHLITYKQTTKKCSSNESNNAARISWETSNKEITS